ncbi:unnamed protein product [Amoebophrya sp. A120]|nr:unnamed protein product [Amoebophrya sp. A120]|eukprot:GSA120T00015274001.1
MNEVEALKQERYQLQQYAEKVTKELQRFVDSGALKRDNLAASAVALPPWANNVQLMNPLIRVYDDRVRELETVLGKSAGLAEQAAALVNENETLREELVQKSEHIAQLQTREFLSAGGGSSSSSGGGGLAAVRSRFEEEREELDALYKMSVEQNEVLAQQNVLLKSQIEKMQQRVAELEQLHGQNQQRARQSDELDRMRALAESELETTRKQLAAHKDGLQSVSEKLKQAQQQEHDWSQKYQLLRDESDERVERISAENSQNLKLFHELSDELGDRRAKFLVLERENVDLSEKYQRARKEADAAKNEAQNMLVLMEQLERKEKTQRQQIADQRAKLDVLEKDLAEVLLEKTKLEALEGNASRSKEDTDRKRKQEMEVILEDMRRATEGQIEMRQRRIDDLEDQLSKASALSLDLQTKYDLLVKQHSHQQTAAEARISLAEKTSAHLRTDLEDLQKRRLMLEKEVHDKARELASLQDKLQETAQAQNRNLQRSTDMKSELTSSLENFKQKLQHKEDTCAVVEKQNATLSRRVADLQKLLVNKEREYQAVIDDERRVFETEKSQLLAKVKTLAAKGKAGEQRAIELLKVQEELRTRWHDELTLEKRSLEEQVDKLKKQCLQLRMGAVLKTRGLTST